MLIEKAIPMAEQIVAAVAPMCEKIEIVGSIRRNRPQVGDIDLVILPKPGQLQAIKGRCIKSGVSIMMNGDLNFLFIWKNVQIDIFFATPVQTDLFTTIPSNFASLMLCRTGSREHNIWFCQQAMQAGCSWNPYKGVYKDKVLQEAETEEDLFKLIGLDYVAPEARER